MMIDKIRKLGESNEDICAIISFGSLHTGDLTKVDEFSDLDLFIFTTNPEKYLNVNHENWLNVFGKPISILVINNPVENNMINRVMLDDYFSLDVIPISYKKFRLVKFYFYFKRLNLLRLISKQAIIERELKTFFSYLNRGYTVHYDKKNITKLIEKIGDTFKNEIGNVDITKENFHECYHDFWQTAYKFLGKIKRDEMLYGIIRLDNVLKRRLLSMLEWETKLHHSFDGDVFFDGKKISQWAMKGVVDDLKKTNFGFEEKENLLVLKNHIQLFIKASKNVSRIKNYKLNAALENKILDKLNSFL